MSFALLRRSVSAVAAPSASSVRSFHNTCASSKQALFETHLHEQARQHGVNARQTPEQLRTQIADALRKKLQSAGFGTEGTLVQLRARWRMAELIETAKARGIAVEGRTLSDVKSDVLSSLRAQLKELGAPAEGNVANMTAKIEYLQKKATKAEKDA